METPLTLGSYGDGQGNLREKVAALSSRSRNVHFNQNIYFQIHFMVHTQWYVSSSCKYSNCWAEETGERHFAKEHWLWDQNKEKEIHLVLAFPCQVVLHGLAYSLFILGTCHRTWLAVSQHGGLCLRLRWSLFCVWIPVYFNKRYFL
jgi:hypothetical protein